MANLDEISPLLKTLGHLMLVILLASIFGAIFYKPAMTNRMYLQDIIDSRTLEQTAKSIVVKLRTSSDTSDSSESDWKQVEEELSECMMKKATKYVVSNDQYLNVRANMETPTILATRFLKDCDFID